MSSNLYNTATLLPGIRILTPYSYLPKVPEEPRLESEWGRGSVDRCHKAFSDKIGNSFEN
jgi:hypothetical protein